MQNYEQAVFISYAWGGEREQIVNQIDDVLQKREIKIVRDKRNLSYKGSIKEFMERIGQGNCVIVVISDKYLRSPNCMFELVEIAENKQFYNRVFPIVLADANIYDPLRRIDYVKYWETKRAELAEAMKTLDPANLQGIRDDMDLYDRIRDKISGLTSILKDMNTLTPEMHQDTNFGDLYDAIEKRVKESLTAPPVERVEFGTEKARVIGSGTSEKAVGGLMALGEFMQLSPSVRNAVIEFQTDFKVAHGQVEQLGDYKDVHDLLHRLQFSCYNVIIHAATRFPNDETALDELTEHAFTFENIIDKLKLVASKPTMPKQELRWIDDAEQIKVDLHNAINSQDGAKLRNVIGRLHRLLTIYPPRINTALNRAAGALRLPSLVNALTRVCDDLTSHNLDSQKVMTFQSGVDALDKLEKALSQLVDSHDRWQTLEVELNQLETSAGGSLDQFMMEWPYVKQKAETLCVDSAEKWANELREECRVLDETIVGNNPAALRRSFRNYQRRVANRFYQVDLDLKALCGNLRQIGTPLASVLELIDD
jgi:hypothetical protein